MRRKIKKTEEKIIAALNGQNQDSFCVREALRRTAEHFIVEDCVNGSNHSAIIHAIYYEKIYDSGTLVKLARKGNASPSSIYRYRLIYIKTFMKYYQLINEEFKNNFVAISFDI